jgi:hypothetical protein
LDGPNRRVFFGDKPEIRPIVHINRAVAPSRHKPAYTRRRSPDLSAPTAPDTAPVAERANDADGAPTNNNQSPC